jgi:TP901-1 family phage major tail protein
MAYDGGKVLLLVDMADEGAPAPDYQPVAEQTGLSVEESRNMIDASHKGHGHTKNVYGRGNTTVSLESLRSLADGTQQRLEDALRDEEEIAISYQEPDGETLVAPALVASISKSMPDSDNATFSASFNCNDFFRPAAA